MQRAIDMKLKQNVLRVFEVRAKPGCAHTLKEKLSDTSVAVVAGKPGNLGYLFGDSLSSDGNDLVFISVWQDLDSVKSRFGEDWQVSFLPEGYEEMIDSCSVRHLQVDGTLIEDDSV